MWFVAYAACRPWSGFEKVAEERAASEHCLGWPVAGTVERLDGHTLVGRDCSLPVGLAGGLGYGSNCFSTEAVSGHVHWGARHPKW